MGAKLADLPGAANSLLGLIQSALELYEVPIPTDDDGTEIVYVSPGAEFAWDGPSLVVCLGALNWAIPGAASGTYEPFAAIVSRAQFIIWLLRAVSVEQDANTPSMGDIAADAAVSFADATGMAQAIFEVFSEYQFVDQGVPFIMQGIELVGPEGGLAGVKATIEVLLS